MVWHNGLARHIYGRDIRVAWSSDSRIVCHTNGIFDFDGFVIPCLCAVIVEKSISFSLCYGCCVDARFRLFLIISNSYARINNRTNFRELFEFSKVESAYLTYIMKIKFKVKRQGGKYDKVNNDFKSDTLVQFY